MTSIVETLSIEAQIALAVVPALGAIFAGIGLLLNAQQSKRTNAQARAALVSAYLKVFAEDEVIQRAFYAIEYSEFKYDKSFHNSTQEREIDKLLRHFANLSLAWQSGLLSTKDVRPVQYYVLRVVGDPEIQKYLAFIEEWSKRTSLGQHPYTVLVEMSRVLLNNRDKQGSPYGACEMRGFL